MKARRKKVKATVPSAINVFDEMGIYWAEIADKNQTEQQINFLKTQLKSDGYVLDLACGTGRHSIPLSEAGYGLVGLDVSTKLLRIAKHRHKKVDVVRGDMRFLPFKPQTFKAAISMDTSFGYLPSEADDISSLFEVQRVLVQSGIFILDVFNREELTLKYQGKNNFSKWKEYPSFFLKQKRTISNNGDWLCDSWTIRDKGDEQVSFFEHSVRLYKLDGLKSLLNKSGFAVKEVYGGYEGEKFSSNSPRLILLARTK